MARHSAPRRSAPRRRTTRRPDTGTRAGRGTRVTSSGLLATAVLSGGALLNGEHLPATSGAVDRATMAVATAGSTAAPPATDGAAAVTSPGPTERPPASFDAAGLVKALLLVERQEQREAAQQAAEKQATERRASSCDAGNSGFETVQKQVSAAGVELRCRFGVDTVYGVAGRSGASDHPSGRALDLMVDRNPGEDLAAYAVANMDRLGISYVIYRQRINFGSGWEAMEDRGGVTANHMDHVHVSFDRQ